MIIEDLVHYGEDIGLARGEALGRAEGEALGRAEGEALGRAEGEARLLAEARSILVEVLDARGFLPAEVERARIEAEPSLDVLRAMGRRALRATHLDEVFRPDDR